MRLTTLGLVALLSLAACGHDTPTEPVPPSAAGSWNGSIYDNGSATAVLSMTLTETGGTVAGDGTLTSASTGTALTIGGTFAAPHVSLTIRATGFNDLNLSATVGASAMTGTLNGSGFVNAAVTLSRQ